MSAYIFAEIDVFDKEQYKAYQEKTPETIKKYGGRFIVRGGNPEILEGQLDSKRMVVIEFQDKSCTKVVLFRGIPVYFDYKTVSI